MDAGQPSGVNTPGCEQPRQGPLHARGQDRAGPQVGEAGEAGEAGSPSPTRAGASRRPRGSGHRPFHSLAAGPFSPWCPLCAPHSGEKMGPRETPNSLHVPTSLVLLGLCLPLAIFPLPPASWGVEIGDPPKGCLQMWPPGGDLAAREVTPAVFAGTSMTLPPQGLFTWLWGPGPGSAPISAAAMGPGPLPLIEAELRGLSHGGWGLKGLRQELRCQEKHAQTLG